MYQHKVLRILIKTLRQSFKSTNRAYILLLLFLAIFSENGKTLLSTFCIMFPAWMATSGVNPIVGGEETKIRLAGKWLMSFLLCHRNTPPCHCSLLRHTHYDYTSTLLFFLSQLSSPAVKHAKANYGRKQTPETHALEGNFLTLQGHFNSKTKTSASLCIFKKELQFLSLAT